MKPTKSLPKPPKFSKIIGPSFILLGLALGSGELILWPSLSARYGLGLLWGALVGITLQYFLNTECMRYALYQGESVFVGFKKLSKFWPIWFILFTFIPWSLPGFGGIAAQIINKFFPKFSIPLITVIFLILAGLLLSLGKKVYNNLKIFEKIIIFSSIPFIFILVILFTNSSDWIQAFQGMVGIGDGWLFFPKGVALGGLLGAFAYAGAGGNINLTQSYYVKEEGFGMGKYSNKISTLFSKENQNVRLEGETFVKNEENYGLWKKWWRLVRQEHALVFWFTGFVTIAMLSVLSFNLSHGQIESHDDLSFLFTQANSLSTRKVLHGVNFKFLGPMFLILTTLALFSTQVVILEASSRIISENVALLNKKKKVNLSKLFFIVLWGQITLGILFTIFSNLKAPKDVLNFAANLNAITMMVSFILILILNRKKIDKKYQPSIFRQFMLILGFLSFIFFSYITFFG
jgi:hypothetical protein